MRTAFYVLLFSSNPTLMAGFYGWLVAQVLKVFTRRWDEGKLTINMLWSSGGMPSSHSVRLCMHVLSEGAYIHTYIYIYIYTHSFLPLKIGSSSRELKWSNSLVRDSVHVLYICAMYVCRCCVNSPPRACIVRSHSHSCVRSQPPWQFSMAWARVSFRFVSDSASLSCMMLPA